MLRKNNDNQIKNIVTILFLIILFVFIFMFKNIFINFFIDLKYLFFYVEPNIILSVSERDELNILREEVKILRSENKSVREEYAVGFAEDNISPVYLLLKKSSIYGDFYVSLPKDKTVYIGMNIFSYGDIVVGQVVEVLKDSLKIERLGQNKTFIGSALDSEESIELKSLSSGLYAGNVPSGSQIIVGDSIVLKGYPKAIIGTVVEIVKNETALNTIFVRTPYNIQNKEMFYVLQ